MKQNRSKRKITSIIICERFDKTAQIVYHRELRENLRPFTRLHSPDEHEVFVQGLLSKIHSCTNSIYRKIEIKYR